MRFLLFALFALTLTFVARSGGVQDLCTKGLLIKGGESHLTIVRMAVLVAINVAQNRAQDRFVTPSEIFDVLLAFDPEHFSQWRPDLNLVSMIKDLQKLEMVEKGPRRKPTEWKISNRGKKALSQHFLVFDMSFRNGERLRGDKSSEGPLSDLNPTRSTLSCLRKSFDQEFAMVFLVLNSLVTDLGISARDLQDRVKNDFPDHGFWVEKGNKGAYPTQFRKFLEKLEDNKWIASRSGAYRTLHYSLAPEGIVAIFAIRAYVLDLFKLLAGSS